MQENSIRPEQLGREHDELHRSDVRQLLQHKAEFIKVPCPACQVDSGDFIFEKEEFKFVRCRHCETIYINPRPSFSLLDDFYSHAPSIKYWNDKIFPASEAVRRSQIFAPRAARVIELCRQYGAPTKLLVDVGAGFGTFCEEVKKLAFFEQVVAIEPSADLAATCARKGIEVIDKLIEDVDLKDASVITNFELIEHLFSPKNFIEACARALTSQGLLIITTPNAKGFDAITLGQNSGIFGGPNHLNYFHPQSLKLLLERGGLAVIETATPGKLDAELVRKKILAGEFDVSNYPFLQRILIDDWEALGAKFQDFLANNNLSSHLWMVAKKT